MQRLVAFFRARGTDRRRGARGRAGGRPLHAPQGDPPGGGGGLRVSRDRRAAHAGRLRPASGDAHGARRAAATRDLRASLLDALADVDRLVLLGDVLELRHGPVRDALDAAQPVLAAIGEALGARPRGRDRSRQPRPSPARRAWLERRGRRRAAAAAGPRERGRLARGRAAGASVAGWLGAGRRARRLSGRVAARRRLRHARPLLRSAHDRADVRAARRRRDGADRRRARRRTASASRTTRRSSRRSTRGFMRSPRTAAPSLGRSSHGASAQAWRALGGGAEHRRRRCSGCAARALIAAFPALRRRAQPRAASDRCAPISRARSSGARRCVAFGEVLSEAPRRRAAGDLRAHAPRRPAAAATTAASGRRRPARSC